MRILLVEDDRSLGETIRSWLAMDGAAVDWVDNARSAIHAVDTHEYAAVLLDRGLPQQAGDSVLTHIRTRNLPIAVLMITAQDGISDRVAGLDLGADDYLVKPFDLQELSARIRAAVRNYGEKPSAPILTHDTAVGRISLDPAAKSVQKEGQSIILSQKEFIVLHRLLRTPHRVVSKEQLEDELYGWGEEIESNAIEVYISHLRKKLGASAITTLRRQGYLLSSKTDG